MTRRERRGLFVGAIVLALLCSALFARAVLAQRAADFARAEARAALLHQPTEPSSDAVTRAMLDWSGGTGQLLYWQALQRFRFVAPLAVEAARLTVGPNLSLVYRLEATATYLRDAAQAASSPALRSRLDDMVGLAYYDDALLHAGEQPIAPELERRAISAFRQAVLFDSSNDAAKTNLEVLLRKVRATPAPPAGKAKPAPDLKRAGGIVRGPKQFPEFNGDHGERVRGGY